MFDNIVSSPQNLILLGGGLVALFLFLSLSLQVIFNKLGDAGWKAWIPFLNSWTFFTNAGMSGAWCLGVWIPILGLVVAYIAVYKISHKLGYDGTGMVFLAIFFPVIWLLVIAISDNKTDEELMARQSLRNKRYDVPREAPLNPGREWVLAGVSMHQEAMHPQESSQYGAQPVPAYPVPAQSPSQEPETESNMHFGYR